MKFVVLGGYGEIGSYIVVDMFRNFKNCEITIAGRDKNKAKNYAKTFKSKRIKGLCVDVTNHKSLVKVLKGAAVCINAVIYKYNLHVMRAALDAKCHYVDLGGLFHMTKKQLKMNKRFKRKNLLAVLGCGSTPGTTNILAAYGASILDSVKEIKITFASYDWLKPKQHLVIPYSAYTLFEEFSDRPAIFTNGKIKFVEPMSGKEYFVFPRPIGKIAGYYTLHSELATFPNSFKKKGLKEASFRVTFDEDFIHDIKLLIAAGLASKKIVNMGGTKVRPIDVTVKELNKLMPKGNFKANDIEYVRVIMFGKRKGRNVELTIDAITRSDKKTNTPAGTVDTAVPPSIVAQMIARGQIQKRGTLPPELCVEPKIFFKELKKRGIKIRMTSSAG